MKIKSFIFLLFLLKINILNAGTLPSDFYMKEKYKKFIKEDVGSFYYIEKIINNNFSAVSEMYSKKDKKIIEKYESVYINPVQLESYNDYYQITKKYEYKSGLIYKINYYIGSSNNCFVKCDEEIFYRKLKKYKINKYPRCLSLFDINERKLKYETDYVKNNCISN